VEWLVRQAGPVAVGLAADEQCAVSFAKGPQAAAPPPVGEAGMKPPSLRCVGGWAAAGRRAGQGPRRWCLRQSQVDELRELVQAPGCKVELVFILDGYDELPAATQFKNLWRTNNLEQFRASAPPTAAAAAAVEGGGQDEVKGGEPLPEQPHHQPKVMITCRSELLSTNNKYANSFLPLEGQNADKDEAHKAVEYFQELRLVPFMDKVATFQQQSVGIPWRNHFGTAFPALLKHPLRRQGDGHATAALHAPSPARAAAPRVGLAGSQSCHVRHCDGLSRVASTRAAGGRPPSRSCRCRQRVAEPVNFGRQARGACCRVGPGWRVGVVSHALGASSNHGLVFRGAVPTPSR
jgi:hypothetical protein